MWRRYRIFQKVGLLRTCPFASERNIPKLARGKKKNKTDRQRQIDRLTDLLIHKSKESLSVTSLQAWLDPESEIISSALNFLFSPSPDPASSVVTFFSAGTVHMVDKAARSIRLTTSKLRPRRR